MCWTCTFQLGCSRRSFTAELWVKSVHTPFITLIQLWLRPPPVLLIKGFLQQHRTVLVSTAVHPAALLLQISASVWRIAAGWPAAFHISALYSCKYDDNQRMKLAEIFTRTTTTMTVKNYTQSLCWKVSWKSRCSFKSESTAVIIDNNSCYSATHFDVIFSLIVCWMLTYWEVM